MSYFHRTIEELWQHHTNAVADKNLEAFLADFAMDCALITPGRVYRGHDEIAKWFEAFLAISRGAEFTSDGPIFEKNVIFIKWHMLSETHRVIGATDTFVVKDGRFETVTVNIDSVPRGDG